MATMKYIGARYMPKFVGTYDATTAYEALSVVDNGAGTTYVSNKPAPAGTPLTDTEYWSVYGSSSGAILDLQQRMQTAESDIDGVENDITGILGSITAIQGALDKTNAAVHSNLLTVGASAGCNFTRINDAITYASQYCNATNRVTILILGGVYNEEITLYPNPGIDLIGIGNVTVQYASTYPNSPLFISGSIVVRNINFLALDNGANSSYGCHIESAEAGNILLAGCSFTSVKKQGLGVGMCGNRRVTLLNCTIISWESDSLYLHNSPIATNDAQDFFAYRCVFRSLASGGINIMIEDSTYRAGDPNRNSILTVAFPYCITDKNKFRFYRYGESPEQLPYIPAGSKVIISPQSIGSLLPLDYHKRETSIECSVTINNTLYAKLIFDDIAHYEITGCTATMPNLTPINTITAHPRSNNCIEVKDTDATHVNTNVIVTITLRAKSS